MRSPESAGVRSKRLGALASDPRIALAVNFCLAIDELGGQFLSAPSGFTVYLAHRWKLRRHAVERRDRIWQGSGFVPVRRAPAGWT